MGFGVLGLGASGLGGWAGLNMASIRETEPAQHATGEQAYILNPKP